MPAPIHPILRSDFQKTNTNLRNLTRILDTQCRSEHNYAEKFPALRARDVAFLEKIDKQHVRGVSSRGAGLAPELEAFAALIADSSGSGGSKKAASSSNGSGGEETKASAASASSSSAPELKKADGSVESVVYGIDRYKASELSVEKFKDEYERFSKPVMISSGCVDNWPSKGEVKRAMIWMQKRHTHTHTRTT